MGVLSSLPEACEKHSCSCNVGRCACGGPGPCKVPLHRDLLVYSQRPCRNSSFHGTNAHTFGYQHDFLKPLLPDHSRSRRASAACQNIAELMYHSRSHRAHVPLKITAELRHHFISAELHQSISSQLPVSCSSLVSARG